ncbi:hypothetical protein MN116_004012 [Schistosoma mekongi]|uniref:Vasohibin n=1 Tax=Schistosoma mekongi TaxID=38744 RepID=A0AAE2D615_SCHME|nr:hypothetical protein MN116_004012 [Schistosoma mekongi]
MSDGTLLINKNGFPIDSDTWKSMFELCLKRNVHFQKQIKDLYESFDNHVISDVSFPVFGISVMGKPEKVLEDVQNYMNKLEYNYTGVQFFPINRSAPLIRLGEVVRIIMKAALPIKCLEATILAMQVTFYSYIHNAFDSLCSLSSFLTQGQKYFKRFTISFVSEFNGNIFRHVVLGVYSLSRGLFGAVGLSRRENLMYKPLKFPSLSLLISNYMEAYHSHYHKLIRVKIGLPIPHQPCMLEKIRWRGTVISLNKGYSTKEINNILDHYSLFLRGLTDVIIKKNLPNISADSFKTTTKQQQDLPYGKVTRLGMLPKHSDNRISLLSNLNKWRSVKNLPVNTTKLKKNQMSTNSYQIRI